MRIHKREMHRKVKVTIGILLVTVIILFITNPGFPDDSKYAVWLEKEHGIFCAHDPVQLVSCVQVAETNEEIDWRSRGVKNTGLYTIYRDHYKNLDGESVNIHAVGILNMFFNK
ncbi:hypothetical protein D3P07_02305 [Paenibacillus sp. 1011MAR3C5]|uniref:hypothetical protein n=1 Tax=Paenibacillus sp. 1011MAR3C5 TaxID=1675787 RepID=UPI000E6C2BF3|nr:hypothetical protein [Paenibacillus sp. 1011MAR3C5]RJE90935.1 hypothetical protein D3P07_02305 [Paenibacillus sp. 1011MAR3C5]